MNVHWTDYQGVTNLQNYICNFVKATVRGSSRTPRTLSMQFFYLLVNVFANKVNRLNSTVSCSVLGLLAEGEAAYLSITRNFTKPDFLFSLGFREVKSEGF